MPITLSSCTGSLVSRTRAPTLRCRRLPLGRQRGGVREHLVGGVEVRPVGRVDDGLGPLVDRHQDPVGARAGAEPEADQLLEGAGVPGERDRLGVLVEVDEPVADLGRLDRVVVEALGRRASRVMSKWGPVSNAPAVGATARQSAAAATAAARRNARRRRRRRCGARDKVPSLSPDPVAGPEAKSRALAAAACSASASGGAVNAPRPGPSTGKVTAGFEPANTGFADRRVRPASPRHRGARSVATRVRGERVEDRAPWGTPGAPLGSPR